MWCLLWKPPCINPLYFSFSFVCYILRATASKAWKAFLSDRWFWPDSPAAAVHRRVSPWSHRLCRNSPFVPPLGQRSEEQSLRAAPGWAASGGGSPSSGHCSLCSSGENEDSQFSSYIKGKEMLRKGVILWRPAPRRSPCRSVRSETGSPAYQSLSRADWRLERKSGRCLNVVTPGCLSIRGGLRRNLTLVTINKRVRLSSSRN